MAQRLHRVIRDRSSRFARTKGRRILIYAARKEGLGQFLYLIECKRYVRPNKVGVKVVRSLHGVLQSERATAGAIVTTSFFTSRPRDISSALNIKCTARLHHPADLDKRLSAHPSLTETSKTMFHNVSYANNINDLTVYANFARLARALALGANIKPIFPAPKVKGITTALHDRRYRRANGGCFDRAIAVQLNTWCVVIRVR